MVTHSSRARIATFVALALSTAFCLALLGARPYVVGREGHHYLVWNLFLAWIPFVVALVVYERAKRRRTGIGQVALVATWLAFLPNAPYIVTDLIHLREYGADPLWFDAMTYLAFAWTGLVLGLVSLLLVHRTVRAALGVVWGWIVVGGAIGLCGIGIYLGRFLRWNSWDIVTNPGGVAGDLAPLLTDPVSAPVIVSGVFASFVGVAYLAMYSLTHLRDD